MHARRHHHTTNHRVRRAAAVLLFILGATSCTERSIAFLDRPNQCTDGKDNDDDGSTDCQDAVCHDIAECWPMLLNGEKAKLRDTKREASALATKLYSQYGGSGTANLAKRAAEAVDSGQPGQAKIGATALDRLAQAAGQAVIEGAGDELARLALQDQQRFRGLCLRVGKGDEHGQVGKLAAALNHPEVQRGCERLVDLEERKAGQKKEIRRLAALVDTGLAARGGK